MIESKIPGITARHAVITPTCREKGPGLAFDQAAEILKREYFGCQVDANAAADYHLVLTVERKAQE